MEAENFKYLGVIINGENSRNVKLMERIEAYWGYQKLLRNKNITTNKKFKICKAAIRTAITYAAEILCDERWREIKNIKKKKKIDEGEYKGLMDHEIREIIEEDIVEVIKAQRFRWHGTKKRIRDDDKESKKPRSPKQNRRIKCVVISRHLGVKKWIKVIKKRKEDNAWNKKKDITNYRKGKPSDLQEERKNTRN